MKKRTVITTEKHEIWVVRQGAEKPAGPDTVGSDAGAGTPGPDVLTGGWDPPTQKGVVPVTEQHKGDEQQVMQLERQWIEAFLRGDTETLNRILADDFIFTDPEGRLIGKAEWIADMTSGELVFESIHIDDLRVRVYGDAAVANGRTTVKARSREGGFDGQYCYTDMYVKREGRWQAVAEQATLLSRR